MDTSVSPVNQSQPRSAWPLRIAWIFTFVVVLWAVAGFFISESLMPNFYSLVAWVVLMTATVILFIIAFISSVAGLFQARQTGNLVLKKKSIVRLVFSLFGLCISPLLLFILVSALVAIVGRLLD